MEMILVDWTRMGKRFCIAGVVSQGDGWHTVRPMPDISQHPAQPLPQPGFFDRSEAGPVEPSSGNSPRNVGWLARPLGSMQRWDIVELLRPRPADIERPHTEDLWVRALRPTERSIPPPSRLAILKKTCIPDYKPYFGIPLLHTRTSAYLRPGNGDRSLVTVIVRSFDLYFEASRREAAAETDVRVRLKVPGVGVKLLPVKDHFLLCRVEQAAGTDPVLLAKAMRQAVDQMGTSVAVRLGLARGFDSGRGEQRCWLMADGFFPAEDVASSCR